MSKQIISLPINRRATHIHRQATLVQTVTFIKKTNRFNRRGLMMQGLKYAKATGRWFIDGRPVRTESEIRRIYDECCGCMRVFQREEANLQYMQMSRQT